MNSASTTIDRCRLCNSRELTAVLDLGRQPLANSLRRDRNAALPTFPLAICRCGGCATIQLTETVAPDILFTDYVWVTGTSDVARRYSQTFYDWTITRCPLGPLSVLEVASNDGTFLKPFAQGGHRVLGVDPARNIAAMAQQAGVPTIPEFFSSGVARHVVANHGEFDFVFARNVIAHVPDVGDVVAGIARCLAADGVGAIEFHRADVILEELHYDSIYHEHLSYHSLHSISGLLERFGMTAFDVCQSEISGGSFVVYFSKQAQPQTAACRAARDRECRLGLARLEPWLDFAERSRRHQATLRTIVEAKRAAGCRIIGYGASARSSTLLNACGIDARHLEVIADRAPLKHDMYTPGTDVLIVPPARAFATQPDVVFLLAWNFRDEILDQIRADFGWSGEVIIPLPGEPVVIT